MASLREWIALSLSALLFSVVAGYGVGRALNARNEGPAPRPAASAVAIVDRTGEPTALIGSLSEAEMEMPSEVASAPVEPPPPPAATRPPTPVVTQPVVAQPVVTQAVAAPPVAANPVVAAPAVVAPTRSQTLPVAAAGERASALISFTYQRLDLMSGGRVLASYRVRFGFDPARVKPGETKIQAKSSGRQLELGWKSFPVVAGGERGFILSPADFEAVSARLAVGAQVATTRERIAASNAPQPPAAAGSSSARVTPAAGSKEPRPARAPASSTPAVDAEQPAFLAAAPRPR
ncbi:MAG: hypothetical protein ACOVVK_04065 [Elsteraceae bacterium]